MKKLLNFYQKNLIAKIIVWSLFGLLIFWLTFFGFLISESRKIDLDTSSQTSYPTHGSDSEQYTQLAENLRLHQAFSLERQPPFVPDGFRTIGYPLFLTVLREIFRSYTAAVIIQFLLLIGTAGIVYKVAQKINLGTWSFVPAMIVLFDPAALFYSFFLLSDTLFNFLLVASFWLLLESSSGLSVKKTYWNLLASGTVLGIAVLVRPIAIFLPIVYLVSYSIVQKQFFSKKIILAAACLFGSFGLIVSPWLWRNHTVFNTWQLSSVGPVTFFEFTVPDFLAQKNGRSLAQLRNEFHHKIGVGDTDDLVIAMNKTSAMARVVTEELRGNYLAYSAFHLYKTLPFFYTSSLKIFVVGTEPFRSNEVLRTIISPPHLSDIKSVQGWSGWLMLCGQILFLLERLLWFIFSVVAICSVIILWRSSFARWLLINTFFIGYFAILTGPVANERYRLPAVPFMALNLTITLTYWYNAKKLDKMPKI